MMHQTEEFSKGFITGGTLFEELGFYYLQKNRQTHLKMSFKRNKTGSEYSEN